MRREKRLKLFSSNSLAIIFDAVHNQRSSLSRARAHNPEQLDSRHAHHECRRQRGDGTGESCYRRHGLGPFPRARKGRELKKVRERHMPALVLFVCTLSLLFSLSLSLSLLTQRPTKRKKKTRAACLLLLCSLYLSLSVLFPLFCSSFPTNERRRINGTFFSFMCSPAATTRALLFPSLSLAFSNLLLSLPPLPLFFTRPTGARRPSATGSAREPRRRQRPRWRTP